MMNPKFIFAAFAIAMFACNLQADEPKCEVIMISTEGCTPCQHWEDRDKPLIPGAKVVKIKMYPTYILIVDGKVKVLEPPTHILGYRSAEKIKEMIRSMRKKPEIIPDSNTRIQPAVKNRVKVDFRYRENNQLCEEWDRIVRPTLESWGWEVKKFASQGPVPAFVVTGAKGNKFGPIVGYQTVKDFRAFAE